MNIKNSIIPDILSDIESAWMVASVLGDTSPKIRIKKVSIPVAIPAPTLPKILTARVVAREEADIITNQYCRQHFC